MKRIAISKNQADAIRADIIEINGMQDVLRIKMQHNKRMTDVLVRDADLDPEKYLNYKLVEEKGKMFLELTPVPDPPSEPTKSSAPAQ
jgi:hypothetical protein